MKNSLNKLNVKAFICLAVLGTIMSIAIVKSNAKAKTSLATKNKVLPPIKNVDIDYTTYKIDAFYLSKLTYGTGSVISVPADAFVDENGKKIKGIVELKYREFHDPSDFFVSGIPMTYDSAGVQYHFESAGMLEILACQNGKPVFVNPNKKIVVEMASSQQSNKYNIYQYDSVAGNWKFIYKDKTGTIDSPGEETEKTSPVIVKKAVAETLLKDNNSGNLHKPEKMNKKNYQFVLEVDKVEFPEIAIYENIQFEVDKKETGFNPLYASITWTDASIEKGKNTGSYLLTLSKAQDIHSFEVNPVFDSVAYETAYKLYENEYKNRKQKEAKLKRANDSTNYVLNKERLFQNDFAKEMVKRRAASSETQEVVKRVFVINGFGIWNSDYPASLPKGEQFAATYTDSTGKKLQLKTLYLVEKGRNAMFSMRFDSRLYYDPSKKNILWAVTSENKLAVFEEEKFKDLKIKNDSCTVAMKIIDKPITKAYQVKMVLNI